MHRRTMSKLSAAFAVSVLALMPACKPREASYKELGWADDLYTLEDKPFTGIAREQHKNGKPSKEYPMKNGRIHGVMHEWWENGQMSAETNFTHGKRHGLNRYWNPEGKLIKEQVYEHGESKSVKTF